MNLLVLLGSLRADSLNARLTAAALTHLPEGIDATVYAGLADLPFYSEDLDGATVPENVHRFRAAVADSDAVLVVTPEYNGSMSAVVKNAIDWASRPRGEAAIAGKPAAVLAASGSPRAAQWAREDAIRVLRVAGAQPLEDTVGIGSAWQAFGVDGALTDAELNAAVRDLMATLVAREPALV